MDLLYGLSEKRPAKQPPSPPAAYFECEGSCPTPRPPLVQSGPGRESSDAVKAVCVFPFALPCPLRYNEYDCLYTTFLISSGGLCVMALEFVGRYVRSISVERPPPATASFGGGPGRTRLRLLAAPAASGDDQHYGLRVVALGGEREQRRRRGVFVKQRVHGHRRARPTASWSLN